MIKAMMPRAGQIRPMVDYPSASVTMTPRRNELPAMTYLTLFFSALVAATIMPAQSEAVLVWHISQQPAQVAVFVLVATVGNVLGAVINWGIGRGIHYGIGRGIGRRIGRGIGRGIAHNHAPKSQTPPKSNMMQKAEAIWRRYGRVSLFASWVPFIGDPLTVIAGVFREPLPSFLLIVTLAKAGRYIVLAALTLGIWG